MEVLKFMFLGKKHSAYFQFNHKRLPYETTVFIVYPQDDEIRFILGESKVFTFNKGKGESMEWECPDNSKMTKLLCESISSGLIEKLKLISN